MFTESGWGVGAKKYTLIETYKDQLDGAILEIGAERGEGSTDWLRAFAAGIGMPFIGFDLVIHRGKAIMTGEAWLKNIFPLFKLPIAFAYLDNFDWIYERAEHDEISRQQVGQYAAWGMQLTRENSRQAHFEQAQLIHWLAAPTAFILFDDTWRQPSGSFEGKGALAVPWLLQRGWDVIACSDPAEQTFDGYVMLRREFH